MSIGDTYEDGAGRVWRVTEIHTARWRARLGPVTAERWEGKKYQVRNFEKDGTFFDGKNPKMNLRTK